MALRGPRAWTPFTDTRLILSIPDGGQGEPATPPTRLGSRVRLIGVGSISRRDHRCYGGEQVVCPAHVAEHGLM